MAASQSQDENEKPAKVWQINEVSAKIDSLTVLIQSQSTTFPTRTEMALELEKRDARIDSLKKNLATYNRVVWILASALIPVAALMIWQLLVNNSRVT